MRFREIIRDEIEKLENETDPMLSVVNMIDVFLAVVIALILVLVSSPLNPYLKDDYVLVKNPNMENMEILIKEGQRLEKYVKSSQIGEGVGVRVGITYRLKDGTLVYVPEEMKK